MNITTYGLDIAKRVFQLYWVDIKSGEIHNRKFGKQELLELNDPAMRLTLIHSCLEQQQILQG